MTKSNKPERIDVNDVLSKDDVNALEGYKVKASVRLAWAALFVAVGALAVSLYVGDDQIQVWATSLISAIAGAAISYGFSSNGT